MFRVGQKVVCWNADWPKANYYGEEILPQKDEVYTIRELLEIAGRKLLRVNEIRNPAMDYNFGEYECAFHITRFRPIVERETDISFAHEILRKHTLPALV